MDSKELGIYIHIPFCKRKCYYCDFISLGMECMEDKSIIEEYMRAVKNEIEVYFTQNIIREYNVTTIYIGGGTPSYIDSKYIVEILNFLEIKLKDNVTPFKEIEITIEINPGTVDIVKLEQYKKANINRLSIGLQSTNNEILKEIGRIHTFEEFLETYNKAKDVGFKNINVDLMIGLPNQTIEDIKDSLFQIIKINPNHISVYSLIIEEGTVIDQYIKQKKLVELDEETERNMYWYVKNTLELNNYNHYEISNFSKKGKESKHNVNCWFQKEYVGIGVAAHSYLKNIRYTNTDNVKKYISKFKDIEKIKSKKEGFLKNNYNIEEEQSLDERKKEYMLLGLRKIEGVQISKFKEKYIDNPIFIYKRELEKLINEGLIIVDGDYIRLTNKGLDLANLVWEEFV